MDYKDNKIQAFFKWIYNIMVIHFLWLAGFWLGLGLFGFLPTTITAFEILNEMTDKYQRERLRVFSFWWTHYKINMKKHVGASAGFSLLSWLLLINYNFLNLQTNFMSYLLFYIMIFLFILSGIVSLWYSYVAARYSEMGLKELMQNAIAFSVSRLIEMIILITLFVGALLLVWTWLPGLVIFIGLGLGLLLCHWSFNKIHDGYGIHLLLSGWRK